jgi:gliding motility-associated-like protein
VVFNGNTLNTSGTYRDTFTNSKGCDSFLYLILTVNDTTRKDSFRSICRYQPVVFNGQTLNTSGVYKDTFVNAKGCDSFLYLILTVNDTTRKDSFRTICKNQSVVFNGNTLNTSGTYRDTFTNSRGCDSFLYLILTVNDTTRKDSFRTICKNQSVVFNGNTLNTSGTYRDTFTNSRGCDSFLYLILTVNDTTRKDSFRTICKNQSVVFNGNTLNTSGTYRDTFTNSRGCDSFLYLILTVNDTTRKDSFRSICRYQPVVFNGQTLNTSGVYRDTFTNAKGCDSFLYLILTVNDTTRKDSFRTICRYQPITFNGQTLNTSGVYKDTFVNSKGCDSFLYLILTVNDTTRKDSFRTICKNQSVVFNGNTLNTSGVYKDTLVNAGGCDFFLYLHLFINDTSKKDSFLTTCKNKPAVFNGIPRNISGTYKDTLINAVGCDSFLYLHLTVNDTTMKDSFLTICNNQSVIFNGIARNITGTYKDTLVNSNGCDSFIYLHLNVLSPYFTNSDTNICYSYIYKGNTYKNNTIVYDTVKGLSGCDSFYKTINLYIYNPVTLSDDSVKGCNKVDYRGELYKKDTSFSLNLSKKIFPFCDSIYQNAVVKIYQAPKATLRVTPDTLVKEGTVVDVKASGGLSYRWAHTTSVSSLQEYQINETTIFTVTVTGENQCDTTLTQNVDLISTIDILEVFSPNQDGNNDGLVVSIDGNIIITRFKIFNRWGQVIFETTDSKPKWDGKFKGDDQPQGSYVYQIEYLLKGKKSFKTGATTLIR